MKLHNKSFKRMFCLLMMMVIFGSFTLSASASSNSSTSYKYATGKSSGGVSGTNAKETYSNTNLLSSKTYTVTVSNMGSLGATLWVQYRSSKSGSFTTTTIKNISNEGSMTCTFTLKPGQAYRFVVFKTGSTAPKIKFYAKW